MKIQSGLTPFGRQTMSHALLNAHQKIRSAEQTQTVDKWKIHRWLCEAKTYYKLTDRTLAVLSALLSFHPETILSNKGNLIVFPSNKQLSLRAHGMADATLRRHIAALIEAQLILRQDSPNGKRYARRHQSGDLKVAFGFSLAPLVARASEFEKAAEQIKVEQTALKETREELTLIRRDITKMIEFAINNQIAGDWDTLNQRFRSVVDSIPRRANTQELTTLVQLMNDIRQEVDNLLINNNKIELSSANESQNERQYYESKSDSHLKEKQIEQSQLTLIQPRDTTLALNLDLVLKACPEIQTYSAQPIQNWQDLALASDTVRHFLNIDNKLYKFAIKVMGTPTTSILIASILQKYNQIKSHAGYLRLLIDKAAEGALSLRTMLMKPILQSYAHQETERLIIN